MVVKPKFQVTLHAKMAMVPLTATYILMFIILKTDYFQLRFLNKRYLRISTAGNVSELNIFKPVKNNNILHLIDAIKVLIGHCHLCAGAHLTVSLKGQ